MLNAIDIAKIDLLISNLGSRNGIRRQEALIALKKEALIPL